MSLWFDLLNHPGWKKLEVRLLQDRAAVLQRLQAVARVSADAAVRAEAARIDQMDALLRLPREAAARGDDGGETT